MQVNRGERLTAAHVRQMMADTAAAARLRVAGAHGRGGISGPSLTMLRHEGLPNGVILANCIDTIPLFGLVEFEEMTGQQWAPIPVCRRVFRYGSSRIGVALAPCSLAAAPVGPKVIPVQISGTTLVRYDWASDDELAAGETLGARKGRVNANRFQHGNGGVLQVLAVGEHDEEWADYNYALVRLSAERLDWQRCNQCGQHAKGNYQVLVFGEGWTVENDAVDGVVLITPPA